MRTPAPDQSRRSCLTSATIFASLHRCKPQSLVFVFVVALLHNSMIDAVFCSDRSLSPPCLIRTCYAERYIAIAYVTVTSLLGHQHLCWSAGLRLQKVLPFAVPSHLSFGGVTQAQLAAQAAQHNVIAWMDHTVGAQAGEVLASAGAQRLNEHAAGHLHHWEF